jgi:hypothetical protein
MSYQAHNIAISELCKAADVKTSKVTHTGRQTGAQHAEEGGADKPSIQRHGNWNSDALSSCYLEELPVGSMRALAGFDATKRKSFFLKRAEKEPSVELQKMIWPELDFWLERQRTGDRCEKNLACKGFLFFLFQLRVTFL